MNNTPSDPELSEQPTLPPNTPQNSHTFVIRIWLEDDESDEAAAFWRGHITHVLDQRRRFFQDLQGIKQFIAPYLEEWGAFHRAKSEIENPKTQP
ncbi:MAG: hypothetical protein H6659_14835 [Ardenticatenaceae bacterium]|nr:hypothetical protein [Anaerolineales bacterium]MCB8985104.1 hypothetical protein [Ardenticatenaceae bacterium]MCB8986645.1 hypothetical protein [Ardenticatenaceae bacterium]